MEKKPWHYVVEILDSVIDPLKITPNKTPVQVLRWLFDFASEIKTKLKKVSGEK